VNQTSSLSKLSQVGQYSIRTLNRPLKGAPVTYRTMDTRNKVGGLVEKLRSNPVKFLSKHQHESTVLEYKASFEYDLAMDLCPLVKKKKDCLLNHALSWRILQSLLAFANTQGGLLLLGVAEKKSKIVDRGQRKQCEKKNRERMKSEKPCYDCSLDRPSMEIGELKIFGLERELSIRNMDFDKFQRHFLERFSLGSGKSAKRSLKFNPLVYPCAPSSERHAQRPWIKVSMSKSLDQYIEEIFPLQVSDPVDDAYTLGVVAIQPSTEPIYVTIEESSSKNILYALPVRKTGKTELEKDLGRVQTYISTRFGSAFADQVARKLYDLSKKSAADRATLLSVSDLPKLVKKYATEWKSLGYPYHLVEEYGKGIKSHAKNAKLWEKEKRPEVLAFLLMVSLHYNAGWEKWTLRNSTNDIAVSALFETFHTNYWRTRFRAFYGLQFMDQSYVSAELEKEKHKELSAKTHKALKKNVPDRTVVSFIKQIAEEANENIATRARQVLTEIATQWNDPDAGIDVPF